MKYYDQSDKEKTLTFKTSHRFNFVKKCQNFGAVALTN